MIYYSTTKSKFLQLLRERFTYASRENDGCLVASHFFKSYEDCKKMLRGTESKQGWIERYNLEISPSTRNRHKKEKPVFDFVLFGAVNSDFDRELIELPDLENLENNDFSMCKIWACLVVTFPKHFYKIKESGTALYDLSNAGHIDQINKRIKATIPNAERFKDIRGMTVFDNYMFEKRKPKITDKQAERAYQKKLREWEKEFAQNPDTCNKKPKKSTPSKHEWTVCLSDKAKQTIKDSLDHLIHIYKQHQDKPEIFVKNVDRIHGFISKYNGHRGVRSDIGHLYRNFRVEFEDKHLKSLDLVLQGHNLNLNYMGQLKDEYKHWGGNNFHKKDNLELMLIRAKDNFIHGSVYG